MPSNNYRMVILLVLSIGMLIPGCARNPMGDLPSYRQWAATPPMGWNSWDCFGASVTEEEVKANTDIMAAELKDYGWEYIVVDIRWYVANPARRPYNKRNPEFHYDAHGRLLPPPNRFPSAADGAGFKPLADYVHGKGLKFGVHLMRGMNKGVYDAALPIEGTDWKTNQVTITDGGASWLEDNHGLAKDEIAQAYYDSVFRLLAQWGVDYVKVDDILRDFSRPDNSYYGDTIEMLRTAIDRCGRPMVLSLSPGPAPLEHGAHTAANANMWRITNDLWDKWSDIEVMFGHLDEWTPYRGPGNWPDADMLPLGRVAIRGERGADRWSLLSRDEQRTLISLWCMARSPLMMGGALNWLDHPEDGGWTKSLLTHADLMGINQYSTNNRQIVRAGNLVVWGADDSRNHDKYIGVFNLGRGEETFRLALADLGLAEGPYRVAELWEGEELEPLQGAMQVTAPGHGARVYRLSPR